MCGTANLYKSYDFPITFYQLLEALIKIIFPIRCSSLLAHSVVTCFKIAVLRAQQETMHKTISNT